MAGPRVFKATPDSVWAEVVANNSMDQGKCANYTSCGPCTDQWTCVWCPSTDQCLKGNFYGPDNGIIDGCKDWQWRQCKVNGKAVFWVCVGVAALVVVVGAFCCFFCCWCCWGRRRRARIARAQKTWSQQKAEEEELSGLVSRTPVTDARRAQIYEKYGTPQERVEGRRTGGLFSQHSSGPINYH